VNINFYICISKRGYCNEKILGFKATKRKQTLELTQQQELTWLILQKDEVGSS
jgi:hypothetical protein